METLSPDPINPDLVPCKVFLCYIHLGVKVRGLDAVEARVREALRPRAQGGLVDTRAEHALLVHFLDCMLETLCRRLPEREWAAGYDDALRRLSRAGLGLGGAPVHGLCKSLYAMLMGFNILPTLPVAALPGLPVLSEWQVKHLACGHGIASPGPGSASSSESSASMCSTGSGDGDECEHGGSPEQQAQQHHLHTDTSIASGFSPRQTRAIAAASSNYPETMVSPAAAAADSPPPPHPPPTPEPQLCRRCSDSLQGRGTAVRNSPGAGCRRHPYAVVTLGFPPPHQSQDRVLYDGPQQPPAEPLMPLAPPNSPPAALSLRRGSGSREQVGGRQLGPYARPAAPAAVATSGIKPQPQPRPRHRHRHRHQYCNGFLPPATGAGFYGAGRMTPFNESSSRANLGLDL